MTHELVKLKEQKKQTSHDIRWGDLPKEHQFEKPLLGRKRLMDAVRMIAYRSETALCSLLTNPSLDTAAARCLLQNLFTTEADISPDIAQGQLHVAIHRGSRPSVDRTLEALFAKLNEMEIVSREPSSFCTTNWSAQIPMKTPKSVSRPLHRGKEF